MCIDGFNRKNDILVDVLCIDDRQISITCTKCQQKFKLIGYPKQKPYKSEYRNNSGTIRYIFQSLGFRYLE